MRTSRGAARTLVLTVIGFAAVLVGVSVSLLVSDDSGPFDDDDPFSEDIDEGRRGRRGLFSIDGPGDRGGDDEEFDADDGIELPDGSRKPHGKVHWWTEKDLAEALERGMFEEVRRQISIANRKGKTIPRELIDKLIALLKNEGTMIDARLCLGMIKDDVTGKALGEFAANAAYSVAARREALLALAESGQTAALAHVQGVVTAVDGDPLLVRAALDALAAMDSDDAARTILEYLKAHPHDRSTSAAVTALGKSPKGGALLAETLRSARADGDEELTRLLIRAASQQGADAQEELRIELRRVVEDPSALDFIDDETDRNRLRSSAFQAAVKMDLASEVIQIAEHGDQELRGVAYYALREARGDKAAEEIAAAINRTTDSKARWNLIVAIGSTGSRKATATLVGELDSQDQDLQQAASSGLAQLRDPKAVEPILERVGRKGNHFQIDQNYVKALGTIGSKSALPKLNDLLDKAEAKEGHWGSLKPWIRNAIKRIETGNPETKRLK